MKDIIEHQYINEKRKLPDLAEYMKVNHNFDAGYVARATSLLWFLTYHAILYRAHQYKYQFKKWNLRKNVPSDAKTYIGRCLQTRAEAGRASTTIQYKGHNVDPAKIRRYLKDKRRQDSILKVPASNVGVVANARLAFGKNMWVSGSRIAIADADGSRSIASPPGACPMELFGLLDLIASLPLHTPAPPLHTGT